MLPLSAAAVIIFDQLTKFLVQLSLSPNQSIPLIKGFLHITYVQNRGAAFGLFYGKQWLLIIAGIVLVAIILYVYSRMAKDAFLKVAIGLVIGGSIGNILDRVFRRYVVDFIDLRFWPVFNLADTMINIGVFMLILKIIFMRDKKDASGTV